MYAPPYLCLQSFSNYLIYYFYGNFFLKYIFVLISYCSFFLSSLKFVHTDDEKYYIHNSENNDLVVEPNILIIFPEKGIQ